ncbi:MAG: stage III sporulation protein AB [Clostridiales bacterium]|nr:stage III sporulation protein AB [Clostridiales bacterium]
MRFLGALMIFACSSLGGVFLGQRRKQAAHECEAFLELFRYVRSQIEYFETPTKLIWRGFENACLERSGFLKALATRESGEIYIDAFTCVFDETKDRFFMCAEAKSLVRSFGSVIGKSAADEQINSIDYHIEQMKRITESEKEAARRDEKLYLTLGISLGAVLFLMII